MALTLPHIANAPLPTPAGAVYRSGVPKTLAPIVSQPLARVSLGASRYRNDPYMGNVIASAAEDGDDSSMRRQASAYVAAADDEFAASRQPSYFAVPDAPANSASSSTSGPQFPFKGAALAPLGAARGTDVVMFSVSVKFRVFSEVHAVSRHVFETEWRFRVPEMGELVVVQGDRGEDVGSIEKVVDEEENFRAIDVKLPRVLRKANPDEVTRFYEARTREDIALAAAQECAQRVQTNVPLSIVAVEYQADLQKLSLVFRVHQPPRTHPLRNRGGRVRVDFRDLQRELFKRFKCRIWLVNEAELAAEGKA